MNCWFPDSINTLKACLMSGGLICVIDKTSLWNQFMTQEIVYFTRLWTFEAIVSINSIEEIFCRSPRRQDNNIIIKMNKWITSYPNKLQNPPISVNNTKLEVICNTFGIRSRCMNSSTNMPNTIAHLVTSIGYYEHWTISDFH